MATMLRALLLLALASPVALDEPPDGFLKGENKTAGYEFYYPKTYKEIPPPVDDPVILTRFTRKSEDSAPLTGTKRDSSGVVSEFFVLVIHKTSPSTATDPSSNDATAAGGSRDKWKNPISFEEFNARSDAWAILSKKEKSDRDPNCTEYRLQYPAKSIAESKGVAWVFDQGDHFIALFGIAVVDEFEGQRKNFEKIAFSLRETGRPEPPNRELEKMYASRPELKDAPFRIARRAALKTGWKAVDTPHFLIVHHTKDESLMDKIQNDVEALRLAFEERFPPIRPVDEVFAVRVCKDRQEFLEYGDSPESVTYLKFKEREIVLCDNVKGRDGSRLGNVDTYVALYWDLFQAYAYYAAGKIEADPWFREGVGYYFAGAKPYAKSTKIQNIDPNPWRWPAVKSHVDKGGLVSLQRVLASPARTNSDEKWAFIYFLEKSPRAKSSATLEPLLSRYFKTLQTAYAENVRDIASGTRASGWTEAAIAARKAAHDAAFKDIDLEDLQVEWESFMKRVR